MKLPLVDQLQQASRSLQQLSDPATLASRLVVLGSDVRDIATRDWAAASLDERELAAARIKAAVVDELIPLASALSMMGLPGIFVYTPCQLAGALALTRVRKAQLTLNPELLKLLAGVLVWGKLGQLVGVSLTELFKPLVGPPLVALAVLPFVQSWTRAVLEQVDSRQATAAAAS